MSDRHLNARELARLVDGIHSKADAKSWRHLSTCPSCFESYSEGTRAILDWHSKPQPADVDPKLRALGKAIPNAASKHHEKPSRRFLRVDRLSMGMGMLALAGSLIAIMILPPKPIYSVEGFRGVDKVKFIRPVEGEVLSGELQVLTWEIVPEASTYEIQIRDDSGQTIWEDRSTDNTLVLQQALELESGKGYRAILSVQPADLLPPGGASVAFRCGGFREKAKHQYRYPNKNAKVMAVFGICLLTLSLIKRRLRF